MLAASVLGSSGKVGPEPGSVRCAHICRAAGSVPCAWCHESYMQKVNTVAQHLQTPEELVESYVRSKRLALAHEIRSAKKVYLDTKFWLLLREVRIGQPANEEVVRLLQVLENLVARGLAICPISADTFYEIFKQTDPKTLKVSTQLIDDLSRGVAMLALDERILLETYHFIQEKRRGSDSVHTLDELVWTKIAYVLGFVTTASELLEPSFHRAVQKAVVDQMWVATLTNILDQIGAKPAWWPPESSRITQQLNEGKSSHFDDYSSFKQLFMIELAGILDIYKPIFQDLLVHISRGDFGQPLESPKPSNDNLGQGLANLIYHGFRRNRITTELPSLRVIAGLHAAFRWNRERKYKPNDLYDIPHAVAAIPYCDYFLTENSLRNLVSDGNLKFETLFRCRTFSDAGSATLALMQLSTEQAV